MDEKINGIKESIQGYFSDAGHTFDHTQRVYNLAVRMAKEENADVQVVKLASLLHDVARFKEKIDHQPCHAVEGAKMAKDILSKEGYSPVIIEHVCECIKSHRYSNGIEPKTKEAAILQDADRLDVLGAITIGRIFGRAAVKKIPMHDPNILPAKKYPSANAGKTAINHFKEKIAQISPETFKTKLATDMAKDRYKYIMGFIQRFEKEWIGEI